jgi:DNA-binding CsgD family transcriptional regulator
VIAEYTGAARGLEALADGRPADALVHLQAVARRVEATGAAARRPAVGGRRASRPPCAPSGSSWRPGGSTCSSAPRARRSTRGAPPVAARIAGLLADDYRPHFERALQLRGGPFERARTRLCFGQRLRRDGLRVDARKHLHSALEAFRGLGAAPWADQAERELGASGEKLRRRAPDAEEELTAQEHQIAALVAGGASNKDVAAQLFLSTKTVEAHLTRIYRKLGVSSRTQLARATAVR